MKSDVTVDTRVAGDHVVISPVGEFDMATVDQLREVLLDAISAETHHIVVDMTRTTFFDSTALGSLVAARRRASEWGGHVRIANPPTQIRKVLFVTGLDQAFAVFDDVASALTAASSTRTPEPA